MTDNDYLALRPGDKIKFTGIHGGRPIKWVKAGDTGEVDGTPQYVQISNKFEVKIKLDNLNTVHVQEADSIDIDWSRQIIPRATLSIAGQPVKIRKSIVFDTEKDLCRGEIECECGSGSLGIKLFAPGHSSWCPGKELKC